jgi:hypothetical protein
VHKAGACAAGDAAASGSPHARREARHALQRAAGDRSNAPTAMADLIMRLIESRDGGKQRHGTYSI